MAVIQRRRALFLDKDGTLVENVPYNNHPDQVRLMPGAGAALRRLRDSGYLPVVVSNQSGVARGLITLDEMDAVEGRLAQLLAAEGVELAGFHYCPHHPSGSVARFSIECECRKPRPGLLLRAAREHYLDPAESWMVGDILDDVEAGNRAGCRTILVDNGGETEWREGPFRTPEAVVPDLAGAAEAILDRFSTHPSRVRRQVEVDTVREEALQS